MKRIAVLASGSGSDLQSILDSIDQGLIKGAQVSVVVSDRADAFALERARRKGIRAIHVPPVPKREGGRKEHERALLRVLDGAGRPDLVVLAGYMRILGPQVLDQYPSRIINIHPALLPAFAGRDGPGDALHYGVRVTGCTTHFVDAGIDSGPVILQGAVPVHPDDDRDTLHKRILRLEHQILPRTVDLFVQDRLHLDGRRVRILPGDSWAGRIERVPEALYPHDF